MTVTVRENRDDLEVAHLDTDEGVHLQVEDHTEAKLDVELDEDEINVAEEIRGDLVGEEECQGVDGNDINMDVDNVLVRGLKTSSPKVRNSWSKSRKHLSGQKAHGLQLILAYLDEI